MGVKLGVNMKPTLRSARRLSTLSLAVLLVAASMAVALMLPLPATAAPVSSAQAPSSALTDAR